MRLLLIIVLFIIVKAEDYDALTTYNADYQLYLTQQALIKTVLVKEGQKVTKGQILAIQDSSLEEIELKQIVADTTVEINLTKAKHEYDYKKNIYNKYKNITAGAVSKSEIAKAKVELDTASQSLKMAENGVELKKIKIEFLKERISKYKLIAPDDGVIEAVNIEKGELATQNAVHIRLIKITPLLVECFLPTKILNKVKNLAEVDIVFPELKDVVAKGVFSYHLLESDPASETIKVVFKLKDIQRPLFGEKVIVRIK